MSRVDNTTASMMEGGAWNPFSNTDDAFVVHCTSSKENGLKSVIQTYTSIQLVLQRGILVTCHLSSLTWQVQG